MTEAHQVDGLVLLNIIDDDPRLPFLESRDMPAVLLGMPADSRGVDAVDLDFAAAARRLVTYLHERGHRDVLFARWSPAMFEAGHAFVRRFSDAAFAAAHELGMGMVAFDCPTEPEQVPHELARALRDRGPATAVLVHDDAATALLPAALHEAGLSAPDDIVGGQSPLGGARAFVGAALHVGRVRPGARRRGRGRRPDAPDRGLGRPTTWVSCTSC